MVVTKNYKQYMSSDLHGFIIKNLKEIYKEQPVKPKLVPESMVYKLYNDGDKIGIEEVATFTMTDGKKYSAYYEHKGFSSFIELL